MAQEYIYKGTPEQLVEQLNKLPRTQKYERTVTPEEPEAHKKKKIPKMITFGMFPQLQTLTDEDFKGVEWRGEAGL